MKNSNHASKALAVVLSGALAFAPAANAALDESNMAYTSAAEGFYGSLRVQYANNDADEGKDNDSEVEAEGSRLGVRGDVDLGGGLGAFYGFEWNLGGPANGDTDLNTRQHHVGLKGDWGSIWLGAFDSVIVRFGGFATTDILDQYSGNFEPIYRTSNAIAYVSPDLNGFQFGIEVQADDGTGKETPTTVTTPVKCGDSNDRPSTLVADYDAVEPTYLCDARGNLQVTRTQSDNSATVTFTRALFTETSGEPTVVADDGNDFDYIGLGASYSIQNLTFSGAYRQKQGGDGKDSGGNEAKKDDLGQYALGIGYSQDNWIVAAMYGSEETSKSTDAPFLSLAAGVSIDKLDVHGLWEQKSAEQGQ